MPSLRKRLAGWLVDTVVPAVFPRLNPAFRWLLRSRFHALADWYVVLLRFQGRRTGRRYEVPVAYHRVSEGVLDAATSVKRAWWRNLRDAGEVSVVFRGAERRASVEIVEDEQAVAAALRARDIVRRALVPASPRETALLRIRLLPRKDTPGGRK